MTPSEFGHIVKKLEKEITDACIYHHRTKKHLDKTYQHFFTQFIKNVTIKYNLYQRYKLTYSHDEIIISFNNFYNSSIDEYTFTLPINKYRRIYKLNQIYKKW
jgi:hypothetical protein